MEMGFNRELARQALLDNNNNLEVALNSLLTGATQLKEPPPEEYSRPPPRGTSSQLGPAQPQNIVNQHLNHGGNTLRHLICPLNRYSKHDYRIHL